MRIDGVGDLLVAAVVGVQAVGQISGLVQAEVDFGIAHAAAFAGGNALDLGAIGLGDGVFARSVGARSRDRWHRAEDDEDAWPFVQYFVHQGVQLGGEAIGCDAGILKFDVGGAGDEQDDIGLVGGQAGIVHQQAERLYGITAIAFVEIGRASLATHVLHVEMVDLYAVIEEVAISWPHRAAAAPGD